MKKILSLFLVMMIVAVAFGQSEKVAEQVFNKTKTTVGVKSTIFSEDFSSWPPANMTVESGATNTATGIGLWHDAAGIAEIQYEEPVGTMSDQWLKSSTISIPAGVTKMSWDFFTSYYWLVDPNDGADVTIKVSTDGGTTWTDELWHEDNQTEVEASGLPWPYENFTFYTATIDLSAYAGSDIMFAIHYLGDNGAQTQIDNILIYDVVALDAELTGITTPLYSLYDDIDITGTLTNVGGDNITSFDVTYNIDGGAESAVYSVTGVDIAFGTAYDFTHDVPFTFDTDGTFPINVTIANVNGGGETELDNNTDSRDINVNNNYILKQTLFEEFTSSTCAPCASVNAGTLDGFFGALTTEEYTLIKYQMNWPAPGDPYYTSEGGARKDFYQVSGVPALFLDAGDVDNGSVLTQGTAVMQAYYEDNKIQVTDMEINAYHQISEDDEEVNIQVTITASTDYTGATLQAAVIENMTTGNVGNNGETEWHNVMMKMVPDPGGTSVDLTAGTPVTYEITSTLMGTFIEEYSDLAVVVFVQNNATKEVYQSANSTEGEAPVSITNFDSNISIYPNPAKESVNIYNAENSNVEIYNLLGKVVISENNISNNQTINISGLSEGTYFVKVLNGTNVETQKIVIVK